MRYPIYDAGRYPKPDVSLVDAYITLIGSNEQDNRAEIDKLPRGDTRRASFQIGRACLLGKRNPSESQRLVRSAHRELDPKHPEAHLRRIHSYRTLARMIELRDDLNAVNSLRRNLHRQAVDSLPKWPGKANAIVTTPMALTLSLQEILLACAPKTGHWPP